MRTTQMRESQMTDDPLRSCSPIVNMDTPNETGANILIYAHVSSFRSKNSFTPAVRDNGDEANA